MQLYRKVAAAVGKNPVAQAVAKNEVHHTITGMRTRCYLLNHNEECRDLLQDAGFLFAVAGLVEPDSRMAGASSACAQMSKTGRWDKLNTVAVDLGLSIAARVIRNGHPAHINDAVRVVMAMS